MTSEELQQILHRGDQEACLQFFTTQSEQERAEFAKECAEWFDRVSSRFEAPAGNRQTDSESQQAKQQLPAASIALLAVCSWTDLQQRRDKLRIPHSQLVKVLRDRRPGWTSKYVQQQLTAEWYWYDWRQVREIVRAGLCDQPRHAHYISGMVYGYGSLQDVDSVLAALRADPDLLRDEFWQLFEVEGARETSLASYDTWRPAICRLAEQGDIPRERLIDSCLDAVSRDFNQTLSRWFTQLHDDLQLSDQEQRTRTERYLALLDSRNAATVSWAFSIVAWLDKQEPLPASELIPALAAVMRCRQKGLVRKALKLLERVVKREPSSGVEAGCVAAAGLAHEAVDVQQTTLKWLEKRASPESSKFQQAVARYQAVVAPSLRAPLADLIKDPAATSSNANSEQVPHVAPPADRLQQTDHLNNQLSDAAGLPLLLQAQQDHTAPIPAAGFDGTEFPRLDPARQLAPLNDIEELLDVCARVLECPELVDEAERAFDGLSRLCAARPENFDLLTGPVLKRCADKLRDSRIPFIGIGADADLIGLLIAWAEGEVMPVRASPQREDLFEVRYQQTWWHGYSNYQDQPLGFLSQRSRALAERVAARQALPLLSAPTHRGGWIDPLQFADRVNTWITDSQQPDHYDLCLAMLRLAPENRGEALAAIAEGSGQWVDAIRYSLGAAEVPVGDTAGLWACAARAKSVFGDDEAVQAAHPDLGPDAGQAARYSVQYAAGPKRVGDLRGVWIRQQPAVPEDLPASVLPPQCHRRTSPDNRWNKTPLGGDSEATVRWVATVWPLAQDAWLAAAADELIGNLDWSEAKWHHKAYLEVLLDPDVPLRLPAVLAIAAALAAREPAQQSLAEDIAIAAIQDGRLDGSALGERLEELLQAGIVKAGRLSKSLAEVAAASPLHSHVVRLSLERSLRGDPANGPRDLQTLLHFLQELYIESGEAVTDPQSREFLSRITGTGKAAKAAKALLALQRQPATASCAHQHALELAIQQRIERVERWQQRLRHQRSACVANAES